MSKTEPRSASSQKYAVFTYYTMINFFIIQIYNIDNIIQNYTKKSIF